MFQAIRKTSLEGGLLDESVVESVVVCSGL